MSLSAVLKRIPLGTATIETFAQGYNATKFQKDLIAGLIVSLVALPLSMALSIAVGLPPQNGLYTAIIAGIVTALFGGSRTQVSGPTAAFVVILAPIVAEFGLRGIVWCQILAGLMLILLGVTRLGKVITFVPYPVTAGFTAGIAVVIATISMNDLLGVHAPTAGHWPEKVHALFQHIHETDPTTLAVGLMALLLMLLLPKALPKIPSALVGVVAATLVSVGLSKFFGINLDTIGSRFSYVDLNGITQKGVPPFPPSLHIPGLSSDPVYALPSFQELSTWFMPALVIAALAGLESLLSATVADSMTGTRHDPNAELNGIGLGNIFSGLFLGIPATGAIARTATNINSGGISPVSTIIHAVLLLAYMMLLAPLIAYIPMTALSALLLVTAWRMSHAKHFAHLLKTAPKSDRVVAIICFVMTVMIDMVAGVISGVVLAIMLFLKRMIETTEVAIHHEGAPAHDYHLPARTMLYRIEGPLFFGTANKAFEQRSEFMTDNEYDHIILDMTHVPMVDVTAIDALEDTIKNMKDKGRDVTIALSEKLEHRLIKRMHQDVIDHVTFVRDIRAIVN